MRATRLARERAEERERAALVEGEKRDEEAAPKTTPWRSFKSASKRRGLT